MRERNPATLALYGTLLVTPSISVVTKVELESGVYAQPEVAAHRRAAIDILLSTLTILDFTNEMARIYGQIIAQAGFNRRKIIDRMIAATAIVHDLTLVTSNEQDFADIAGLNLSIWDA